MSRVIIPQNFKNALLIQHKISIADIHKNIMKATTQSLIIQSYMNKDYISLIKILLKHKPFSNHIEGPNYINGIGLLTLNKLFNGMNVESDKFRLFLNSTDLLERISLDKDVDTQLSYVLLIRDLQNWIDKKEFSKDEVEEFNQTMETLWSKIRSKKLNPYLMTNSRIHSQENIKIASNIVFNENKLMKKPKVRLLQGRYDKNLKLVDDIQSFVDKSNFISGLEKSVSSKEQFMSMFKKQLSYEHNTYFKVKNLCRDSKEDLTAEMLIDSFGWLSKIKECFKECREKVGDPEIILLVSLFDPKEMSKILYMEVIKMLSLGQSNVEYSAFQNIITRSFFLQVQKHFINDIVKDNEKMYIQAFDKYSNFFLNDNLRRLYRPREYWNIICNELNINPDISIPFSDINASFIKQKLAKFLSNVLCNACQLTKKQLQEIEMKHPEISLNAKAINSLQIFSVKVVPKENEISLYDPNISKDVKFFTIDSKFLQYIQIYQFENILFHTGIEMPMLVPPRPFLDYGNGGPLYTSNSTIIKDSEIFFKNFAEKQMKRRLKNKFQGRPVWDSLNELGCVPWKINKPVLEIMLHIFKNYTSNLENESFLNNLGFPLDHRSITIPNAKDHVDLANTTDEKQRATEFRKFFKLKALAQNKKSKMNSLTYWMLYRLTMANFFKDDILYFPHNLDFRGRAYPSSPYLSHMGDDVSRSLLVFADGRKLGPDGLRWLKLHCINLTGFLKKEPIEKRLEHVEEILENKIRDSARDPLNGSKWWMESEEPWQTLTACIEIDNALKTEDPSEFISYMPVHQDGSCNGLQHYAALGRDKDGGREVNLLPSDRPADIYSVVANKVDIKREIDEKSENKAIRKVALLLRKEIPDKLPRKLLKQTVMTTVYGVTEFGASLQIARQLKNLNVNYDNITTLANYLKDQTLTSLSEAFTTSMEIKEWFRKCAGQITGIYKSVEWITPLGFPVHQPYMKIVNADQENEIECEIPIKTKQINAFPPNFIHSLDSTHMMLTSLNCTARNITFASVHDCFWTHASTVSEMNKITRNEFIKLHSEPLVDNLGSFFKETYVDNSPDALDDNTKEKLLKIFNYKFKKGELDINEVRNSMYFFS